MKPTPTPEMIAAAWATWHSRHGGKLGPGPAFVEAISAALSVPAAAVVGEPVAWRYKLENWGPDYWQYFTKEPRHKEPGEFWQPLYDAARLAEAEELARVMEAESNQMREVSISNRHRAEAAEARLSEALAEVAEFKARYEAWRPVNETPNETYILSGALFDFYCEEPDADGEDSAFSLVTTWDERPEQAVMWCRIVTPRWPTTEDFTSDRSLAGGRS